MDKRKLESHIIFCSFIYSSIGGDVVKDFLSLSNIRQTLPTTVRVVDARDKPDI